MQFRRFIQVMNTLPAYLRVGPVVIHLHSREMGDKPTSILDHFSLAEPTPDVQGSVFLSPDDGTLIHELNGVVRGFFVHQRTILIREWCLAPFQRLRCLPVNRPDTRTTLRSFPFNSFFGF